MGQLEILNFCFATERSALSGRCVIGSFNSAKVRFIQQSRFSNKEVPFGAVITLDDASQQPQEKRSTIVGDSGQAYLTGLSEKGRLFVKWGDSKNSQCYVNYDLSTNKSVDDIVFYAADCR